jgi:murein DD-endopeptidase MepM/ murein hydrolase activator NlpD
VIVCCAGLVAGGLWRRPIDAQRADVAAPPAASLALGPVGADLLADGVAMALEHVKLAPEVAAAAATTVSRPVPDGSIRAALGKGETLDQVLVGRGVERALVQEISRALRPVFDFRYARPGDSFALTRSRDGSLEEFVYTRAKGGEQYRVVSDGEKLVASKQEPELLRRSARIAGVVSSNLYEAIGALGEDPELARDFADVFAWDIDFSRDMRPGDEFSIVYERLYRDNADHEPVYLRPGRILAARYGGSDGVHTAVYFETGRGEGAYYRPDGSTVQKQFLRAPLNFRRISSTFTNARFHPILKRVRAHQGIDYAAPHGAPVWAVASGRVVSRGWIGGFGNTVKIQHAGGYVSTYGHLSRFASGLRVGDSVSQKQVIGYVGSTGLSTGPHVCFRIQKNGAYVNPARVGIPTGEHLAGAKLAEFRGVRDARLAELGPAQLVETEPAL